MYLSPKNIRGQNLTSKPRTRNTSHIPYTGPNPKDINSDFPDHTYELITCLLNGVQKKKMEPRWLKNIGSSKEEYQALFPGAPMMSRKSSDAYANRALNDGGIRSKNMASLNASDKNSEFHINRRTGRNEFNKSQDGKEFYKRLRKTVSDMHKNGEIDYEGLRQYFREKFPGSDHQKRASARMTGENNIVHIDGVKEQIIETWRKNHDAGLHDDPMGTKKKRYKDTALTYQSSYERDFLELCERNGVLDSVTNAKTLSDELYPWKYYLPDFILFGEYSVEIKSWYIEQMQDNLRPGNIQQKKLLVERKGLRWLYVKDCDYTEVMCLLAERSS